MYKPVQDLFTGIDNAFPAQMFPWDEYFPAMAEADWILGRADTVAVKSFFIRNAPFGGSYTLLGGITDSLRTINDLKFNDPEFITGMRDGGYSKEFIDWLVKREGLRLQVYTPPEGNVFFPNEPIVTVVGPLADIRLVEGIITEGLNFPSLDITKWYRLVRVVRPGDVLDFSRRRAQNHLKATLYSMLAGCFATSNKEARRYFDFLVVGTMGHEWIQSFGDVREAFRAWLDVKPNKPVGLVDTLQCMEHDFPIWLDEVFNHREAIKNANPPFWGWRNDSGDLAALTIDQYLMFFKHPLSKDRWFVDNMKIILTNDLDEYTAESIITQIRNWAAQAGIDAQDILRRIIWAAGTKPGTCADQSSLGGVAKLMEAGGYACLKLAFDAEGRPGIKTSIPGFNRSALICDRKGDVKFLYVYPVDTYELRDNGCFWHHGEKGELRQIVACHKDAPGKVVELSDYLAIPQQELLYDSLNGNGFTERFNYPTIKGVAKYVQENVDRLPWNMTRIDQPQIMQVYLAPELLEMRQRMIEACVLRIDKLPAAA